MNLRTLIKEQLRSADYQHTLTQNVGDDELATYYLDQYTEALNRLNQKGGEVYRLVFAPDAASVPQSNEGTPWTFDKDSLQGHWEGQSSVFLLKAQNKPGSVDVQKSMDHFVQHPTTCDVVLVRPPITKKIIKLV